MDRLIDEAHAAVVEATVVLLKRHGWIVEVEVSFAIWGERGSIDMVGFHPSFGALLIIEVKASVPDSQATIHGLDRKTRLAREVVADRHWEIRHVSRLLVVAATATSRRRVARLAATYDTALPARGATVRNWLSQPEKPIAGLLFVANDSRGGTRRPAPGRERVRRRRAVESRRPARSNDSSDGG